MTAVERALDGARVVEFGAYAAGPHVGKLLANFGACVVHVESHRRPDGFRTDYPPFKDGVSDPDRGACFPYFNDSKYGVTIDLKSSPGSDLGRRLLRWADIVIENMRPGVLDRLGLGYSVARELNPDIVMLSSCNMGQTGPRAHTPGFGSQLSALAGFCNLTGTDDGPPMLLYGPYIDFIASALGTAAVLAAYHRARQSGEPAWIDLSQYEAGLHFQAAALYRYYGDGSVAHRRANRDPEAVPHDAYPCADGRYVALSCWCDDEFRRLCAAMGQENLHRDPRYSDAQSRREQIAELDAQIASWTRVRTAADAARLLQDAGVHAHAVNDMQGLFEDPQLVHRRIWRVRKHPGLGEQAYCYPGFELQRTPGEITSAGPLLGADNERVCRDLLGMSPEEYRELVAQGAFE